MFRFFKGGNLQALKLRLGQDQFEGIDEDGQTKFFHQLNLNIVEVDRLPMADLCRYDLNIVKHWQSITELRNRAEDTQLHLKYFQYLSLLFSEIYLDWYFNHQQLLLDGLNEELERYRNEAGVEEPFEAYQANDLNKIAFWSATGSGKTLLLHANIHQYLHYYQKGVKTYPDKIILLTPNEGLSRQHLEELKLSGFGYSQLFDKSKSPFPGTIEIIDINKLGDEMGEKTVAVSAFEGKNLVLVDEGHRGTGTAAGAWLARREVLCRDGFAFEYSATFGQAVGKGFTVAKTEEEARKKKAKILFQTTNLKKLEPNQLAELQLSSTEKRTLRTQATREIYAKCILFDYSYKFFYEDGYGKDSLILNLAEDNDDDIRSLYLTACLLSFYQQQFLWSKEQQRLAEFQIEKPLWVFVGNKVNDEDSDILTVVRFLANFLNSSEQSIKWLGDLIAGKARLLDAKGRNIFEKRFLPLSGKPAVDVFDDILKRLFNADTRQRLKLVNLKGSKGELALRVGTSEPFGIINIGDDSKFFNSNQEDTAFDNENDEFGGSLFGEINRKDSLVHVLIGSRKFTEGWSSWRVSTMGLLNMGQGEGSQIIQLFGRGVRLKGRNFSLKRSTSDDRNKSEYKGLHLERLETLNIFGVRANYMAQFKAYLIEEGVTPSDEILELDFPTSVHVPKDKLKTLILKDGYRDNQAKGFKRSVYPVLYEIPTQFVGKIKLPHAEKDAYPKLEALRSGQKASDNSSPVIQVRQQCKVSKQALPFFNWDRIYLALQDHKLQYTWSNLRLDRTTLIDFCTNRNDWYTLHIPASEMDLTSVSDIAKQEDLLIELLQDYTGKFYKALKNAYEGQFYAVAKVSADDSSVLKMYHIEIEDTPDGLIYQQRLLDLKKLVDARNIGDANKWSQAGMVAICFDKHLYYPLLGINGDVPLKLRPLAFDADSEIQFVKDLESWYNSAASKEFLSGKSLYLLRNADTQGKGLGFALAGNFYPDFLLWIVDETTGKQWLNLIDPKGIRNMDLSDPKFGLYKEIKTIETKLNDPNLILNAFILSITSFGDLLNVKGQVSKQDLEDRNVLFMDDSAPVYLGKMTAVML